jgi:hypothetical protein
VTLLISLAVVASTGCRDSPTGPTGPRTDVPPGGPPNPPPGGFPPTGQTAVLVAVGDIGECGSPGVQQAAALADRIGGDVILAGDLAYYQGSMQDYMRCFDPYWGQFRSRWRPTPGNHEYDTPGAAGYFQYFGEAAGSLGRSFYSFRAGSWLVLMLDSNIPTRIGSPQFDFVRSVLLAQRAPCTMAVWHHPLFSSGPNGPNSFMRDMWALLHAFDADVIVAAHDHLYERFGKQDADGRSDAGGLRQFVVGTGGAHLYDFMRITPNSQARLKAHGVLRLTLEPTRYDWAFIDASGGTADLGSDTCH